MPSCPGCGKEVAYADLPSHVYTCKWVWSDDPADESNRSDALAARIRQLERQLSESSEAHAPTGQGIHGQPNARDSRSQPEDARDSRSQPEDDPDGE